MKIGILTYHAAHNFGANLQVLSTIGYLKRQGHEPIVFNWIPNDFEKSFNRYTSPDQANAHKQFQESYLPMTVLCRNSFDIAQCIIKENIDGVIIGSDSVFNIKKERYNWRKMKMLYPTSDHIFPNPFWGEFLNYGINIPIAGLSISSQNANFLSFSKEKKIIGEYLGRFKYISVRDNWTKDLVSYFTNGNIISPITPDPVFAFNSNISQLRSKEEILSIFNLPEEYFLLSFSRGMSTSATHQWIADFQKNANKNNISCVQLARTSGGQELKLKYKINHPLSPIDWYYLIKYSKGYVGVLMHPIVIAMHNCVPFFSFDHYGIKKIFSTNIYSSKIYHIVNDAGFLSQYFSLNIFRPFPSAEYVVKSLLNFDKRNCKNFAIKKELSCFANMDHIVQALGKKY